MDDSEYYAMMRRQYSNPIKIRKTPKNKRKTADQTPGTYTEWNKKYGHEDAEMFLERNSESSEENLNED